MKRRRFIYYSFVAAGMMHVSGFRPKQNILMTVKGPTNAKKAGLILAHEHILVDFIGASQYDPTRWERDHVVKSMLPYLNELKRFGCSTFIDFTPAFLGRDPLVLRDLSEKSGLNIITNTGFYGAVDNKYLPESAFKASADNLANIWVNEFESGIADTGIKPGFIKMSVNPGSLSDLHKKLVRAAAITHLNTGLTIASHTGPAIPAFEQLDVLKESGVHPSAFIWVHAQNEKDQEAYIKAAEMGAWVSLDGVQEPNIPQYVNALQFIKENGFLNKVLVSQDAGWYDPGKTWEGVSREYTALFEYLIPELKKIGFNKKNIRQLLEINPREAFTVGIRRL